MNNGMKFENLEKVYDLLARAIDEVGPANEAIFLSKVCLVLSHAIDDIDFVEEVIHTATQDINPKISSPAGHRRK